MKINKDTRRKVRTRAKVKGNQLPRLSVFRSNKYIYAQVIDDSNAVTLVAASEKELDTKTLAKDAKRIERARQLGMILAKKALDKKVKAVVFDRGSYAYNGRVKAIADGAREGGLEF